MGLRARLALTAIAALSVTACSLATPPQRSGPTPSQYAPTSSATTPAAPTPTPTPAAAQPTVNVADKASNVPVDTVLATHWPGVTLSKISATATVSDNRGTRKVEVPGTFSAEKWTAVEGLDPNASYTMTISGADAAGQKKSATRTFTTAALPLNQQAFPAIFPVEQGTFGVGMIFSVTFDTPVTDRANAERQMVVTATPKQEGTWAWVSDTEVRYRPKQTWRPGTTIDVDLRLNGVKLGPKLWGQESRQFRLTIAREQTTHVNLKTKKLTVTRGGKVIKSFPISAGKAGFDTRNGTKMISARVDRMRMDSETTGVFGSEGYSLMVDYALHLTNSGEYIHAAPWNAGNMGKVNASHGCTGMMDSDAYWLFSNSLVGDLVTYTGGQRGTDWTNGHSDWNLTWRQYKKHSALG